MRLWIDACLSPTLEDVANDHECLATSNRRRQLLTAKDQQFYPTVVDEDWVFVTNNAGDFRDLANLHKLHPGLIILPARNRATQQRLFDDALTYIEEQAAADGEKPRDWIFMREVVVHEDETISHDWLPEFT